MEKKVKTLSSMAEDVGPPSRGSHKTGGCLLVAV